MDLLLWRHAEAEEGGEDMKRQLTERGQRQAKAMANWLRTHQPRKLRIIASPAVRARQTVEALGQPFETIRKIGPEACVSELIAASAWPSSSTPVLIVGHQPTLGRLAALLLSGQEAEWSIKKGALWWLSRRLRQGQDQTVLRAVISADMAEAMQFPAS